MVRKGPERTEAVRMARKGPERPEAVRMVREWSEAPPGRLRKSFGIITERRLEWDY